MKTYDIKNPAHWDHVLPGEKIEMPAVGGRRAGRLTLNTTKPVTVWIAASEDMKGRKLVAHDVGMFEVCFSTSGTAFLEFESADGAIIYVAGHARSQIIKSSGGESFTSVMPMGRRNSDFDRMMQFMRLNELRRDQQLATEREQWRAERAELLKQKAAEKPADKEAVIEKDDANAPVQKEGTAETS